MPPERRRRRAPGPIVALGFGPGAHDSLAIDEANGAGDDADPRLLCAGLDDDPLALDEQLPGVAYAHCSRDSEAAGEYGSV